LIFLYFGFPVGVDSSKPTNENFFILHTNTLFREVPILSFKLVLYSRNRLFHELLPNIHQAPVIIQVPPMPVQVSVQVHQKKPGGHGFAKQLDGINTVQVFGA